MRFIVHVWIAVQSTLTLLVNLKNYGALAEERWYMYSGDSRAISGLFDNRKFGELATFPTCFRMNSQPRSNGSNETDYRSYRNYLTESIRKNQSLLKVYFALQLFQVIDVNQELQRVSLSIATKTIWRDCRLTWAPTDLYADYITLPLEEISKHSLYMPRIRLLEDVDPRSAVDTSPVSIDFRGTVIVAREMTTTVSCNLDVRMYPFGTHLCRLTFESPATRDMVDVVSSMMPSDVVTESDYLLGQGRFIRSDTWMVAILPPVVKYRKWLSRECTEMWCFYKQLEFKLILRRHPDYQIVSLMVPALLVVAVSSSVFLLPPGSGDKVSLSLTILLSMLMFTQIMFDMPDSGATLPLISQYFMVCIGLVSSSCMFATVNAVIAACHIKVPGLLQRVVRKVAPCLLFDMIRKPSITILTNGACRKESNYCVKMVNRLARFDRCRSERGSSRRVSFFIDELDRVGWPVIAALADRCFFILQLVSAIVMISVFVCSGYAPWASYESLNMTQKDYAYVCAQLRIQKDANAASICKF